MLQLHTSERPCGATFVAGLKAVSLIDPLDLSVPVPRYTVPRIGALQFKPGRAAFFVQMEFFTGRFEERMQYTEGNGHLFEHAVTFEQRGINTNTDFLRAKLANRRVHALCVLQDNSQRLVQDLLFQVGASSGDSSNRNQYGFEGRVQKLRPAATLEGNVNVITPPYVPPTADPGGGSGFEPSTVVTSQPQYTVQVPSGKLLMAIFVQSTQAQFISIGYTAGGSELAGPMEQEANLKYKYGDNWLIAAVNTNIYITGLAGTNTITICIL